MLKKRGTELHLKEKIRQLSRKKISWIAILTISNTATLMCSNHLHHLYHQQVNERMKWMEVQEAERISILRERVDFGMDWNADMQEQMNQVFACLGLANQILEDFQALAERAIKNPVQYQETVQSFLAGAAPALYRIEGVLHQGRSFSRDKHHAESLLPDLQPNLNSVDIEYVSLEEEQEETYK